MNKLYLTVFTIWVFQSSCDSIRTLEGRARPVYFTADASIFTDTLDRIKTLWYQTLSGLKTEEVELDLSGTIKTYIRYPTFFHKGSSEFLIYPKEHIYVSGDSTSDDFLFTTLDENEQRDNELLFLKVFRKLLTWPTVPIPVDNGIETILDLESEQITRIRIANESAIHLFDSLLKVYRIREKFKNLVSPPIKGYFDINLLTFYEGYRDSLSAYGLYLQKLWSLLPALNSIERVAGFGSRQREYAHRLYSVLFPGRGIRGMQDATEFRNIFDSVVATFRGVPRGYLLAMAMYSAIQKGFDISTDYYRQFKRYAVNKEYRKIIRRAGPVEKKIRNNPVEQNELLLVDGKTKTTFEKVLAMHKSKYVLVDFWASWCVPCIREMPALHDVVRNYAGDKLVLISISVNKQTLDWRKALQRVEIDPSVSYMLLEQDRTPLHKQLDLNTIPRYILYDRSGKLIQDNLPPPTDPEFKVILNKYLKEIE